MISNFRGRYRFLSNFWPATVIFDDLTYPSVEHAYQAAKTYDKLLRRMIQEAETAGEAKKIGRNLVKLRSDWDFIRLEVMEYLLRQKFNDPELRKLLLSTANEELVEGNTWCDVYFGVCYCKDHNGEGANVLGTLLMKIRTELRHG